MWRWTQADIAERQEGEGHTETRAESRKEAHMIGFGGT